jgi:hypothetical protein
LLTTRQATFPAKRVRSEHCDHGLLIVLGDHSDFDLAFLDVKHGICDIASREYLLIFAIVGNGSSPIQPNGNLTKRQFSQVSVVRTFGAADGVD